MKSKMQWIDDLIYCIYYSLSAGKIVRCEHEDSIMSRGSTSEMPNKEYP